jgi:hypothetical protein
MNVTYINVESIYTFSTNVSMSAALHVFITKTIQNAIIHRFKYFNNFLLLLLVLNLNFTKLYTCALIFNILFRNFTSQSISRICVIIFRSLEIFFVV